MKKQILIALFLCSNVWSCKSRNTSSPKDIISIDKSGQVLIYYREGETIIVKNCGQYVNLRNDAGQYERKRCTSPANQTVKVPLRDFIIQLKMALYIPMPYDTATKDTIQKVEESGGFSLDKTLSNKAYYVEKLKKIQAFKRSMGITEETEDEKRYKEEIESIDKWSLKGKEAAVAAITSLNKRIETIIQSITSTMADQKTFATDQGKSFAFHILRSYFSHKTLGDKKGAKNYYVKIPSGTLWMGSGDNTSYFKDMNEKPLHKVAIPSFRMTATEVTQKQWFDVMGTRPWQENGTYKSATTANDDHPAVHISWIMARNYIAKLNNCPLFDRDKDGAKEQDACTRARLKKGLTTYRLPSEAEWEYAARGNQSSSKRNRTLFSFGDKITTDMVNFDGTTSYNQGPGGINRGGTIAVGALNQPNYFGLHDMHGNVAEWTDDIWHDDYKNAPSDGSPWLSVGGKGSGYRVIRGGHWNASDTNCQSKNRSDMWAGRATMITGFRLVRMN